MDNLILGVTKAITDLLEQSEKRFIRQQTAQEDQGKILESLQTKIDGLEAQCQQLIGENNTLKEGLKKSKENDEKAAEELAQAKSEVEKLQRGLTDFEKRFVSQQTTQGVQEKVMENLQSKVDGLGVKCQQLIGENNTLNEDLKKIKKRDEESVQELAQTKAEREKLQKGFIEFDKWANLITVMADHIKDLGEFKVNAERKLEKIIKSQNEIAKQSRFLQQQFVANSLRTPVKSPSTSSFLNDNMHSSLPSYRSHKYNNENHYLESLEPSDDISEIGADAEKLRQELDTLNDIQRSFEKSSLYSDDYNT